MDSSTFASSDITAPYKLYCYFPFSSYCAWTW